MSKNLFIILIIGFIFVIGGFFYFKGQPTKQKENQFNLEESFNTQTPTETQNQEVVNQIKETQNQETINQTKEESKVYSMDEVTKHNSKNSCWSVIRGKVYNLTDWVDKHPGGSDKILNICGKDGTEIFEKVHGGKEKPENILKRFEIGILE